MYQNFVQNIKVNKINSNNIINRFKDLKLSIEDCSKNYINLYSSIIDESKKNIRYNM